MPLDPKLYIILRRALRQSRHARRTFIIKSKGVWGYNTPTRDQSVISVCQTGIIRTRFSAADFRLNRVIRLANTKGY